MRKIFRKFKTKKIYIGITLISLLLVGISYKLYFSNKNRIENKTSQVIDNRNIAYTLNGLSTDKTYEWLIINKVVDSVTCEKGTVATWNYERNSLNLSGIIIPDYCIVDFKDGYTITLTATNGTITSSASASIGYNGTLNFDVTPNDGYKLEGSTVSCTGSATGTTTTTGVKISSIIETQTCTVTLKPNLTPIYEKILADNPTVSTRTDFSVTNVANTTGTIYSTTATEDGSTVYYYSGNTTNNWVKLGTYTNNYSVYRGYYSTTSDSYKEYSTLEECNSASDYNYNCSEYIYWNLGDDIYWRIIRTNEDGSVRLLYAGISPDTTNGHIGISVYSTNTDTDPMYIGYMYGSSGSLTNNRTNENSNTIKTYIDNWYQSNLLTNYDKYISKTAIYCNDRSIGSGTYNTGFGRFYYGAYTRLQENKTPTYKCGGNTTGGLFESTQAVEDKFSASTEDGGNGQLQYGVALMTADEVAFAGGVYQTSMSSPYAWYYTNSESGSVTGSTYWWTMTPNIKQGIGSLVYSANSDLSNHLVGLSTAIRPSVSLKSCVLVSEGDGTSTSPYQISIDDACISVEN